jgi:2-polyprenyl-3-methyl-5-hydroxy-6-metoxy-1,4-benzoquinol methylase
VWLCIRCGEATQFAHPDDPWPPEWRCASCGAGIAQRDSIPCLAPHMLDNEAGYDAKMFAKIVKVEESNFWFVCRAALIVGLIARHFAGARSMLEIGCGTGSVLQSIERALPHLKLMGSELSPHGLVFAKQRLQERVTLLQMDARSIPARAQFDIIGAFDVIEHIKEDEAVLQAIRAALKPGGGAIITVPQHPWLWSPADESAHHQRRYRRRELETKLQRCGFSVMQSSSFNAVMLPVMFASRQVMRLRAKTRRASVDFLSEFRIPSWLNGAAYSLLRFETMLTQRGVNWPAGGSRVVVARRA